MTKSDIEWLDHCKFIESLDLGCDKIPCLVDVLNLCVREVMNSIIEMSSEDKSIKILQLILRRISRIFYNATLAPHRSKALISNICRIEPLLPLWSRQFILIKKMFKIEPVGRKELTTPAGYCMVKLNQIQRVILKEFVLLFDPINQLLNEIQTKNEQTTSINKVMPCYQTLLNSFQQMQIFHLNEIKKKIQTVLNTRLDFLNRDPIFRIAAVLDPKFGTFWAPPFEKTRLELLLVENLCLDDDTVNINSNGRNSSQITPKTNTEANHHCHQGKYTIYDESYLLDRVDNIAIHREEVSSYLKYIRSNNDSIQMCSSDLFKFWSVNCKRWPGLAKLAKKVYSVHVSTYGVERSLNLDSSQTLLNHPDHSHIEKIIFLKCNKNLN